MLFACSRKVNGFEIERQAPERERSREDVCVRQRALRVPDRIDGGEQSGGNRGACAQQVARKAEDSEQSGGRDHADEGARSAGDKAREMPPARQQDRRQRRVRVGHRGDGNQRAGAEEVPRRRDVVSALVPEVGQAQQRQVRQVDGGKEDRIELPQRRLGARVAQQVSTWRAGDHAFSGRDRRAPQTAAPAPAAPKVCSYWARLWPSTFSSALACCGLR